MEFETFFGFLGLGVFICALFDFEWFFTNSIVFCG
jgi:hypothetical protein